MEITPITIGILVAVWVVGYLLGLAEAAIKNDNKEKKKSEEILPVEDGDEIEDSLLTPEVLEPEVLTIFERISGALKLRLDGEIVEYKSDLNTEQRARLMNLVISLRPWLDAPKIAKPFAPLPAGAKIPTTPPDKEFKTIETSEVAEEIAYSKLSMVEQINQILQKKLVENPLDNRGIQLRASASGGLLIQIGLDEYEWIDEIPEQDIQDIIRESIAEWDENTTLQR